MLHKENNKHFIAVLHRTVKVGPSMWSITGTEGKTCINAYFFWYWLPVD